VELNKSSGSGPLKFPRERPSIPQFTGDVVEVNGRQLRLMARPMTLPSALDKAKKVFLTADAKASSLQKHAGRVLEAMDVHEDLGPTGTGQRHGPVQTRLRDWRLCKLFCGENAPLLIAKAADTNETTFIVKGDHFRNKPSRSVDAKLVITDLAKMGCLIQASELMQAIVREEQSQTGTSSFLLDHIHPFLEHCIPHAGRLLSEAPLPDLLAEHSENEVAALLLKALQDPACSAEDRDKLLHQLIRLAPKIKRGTLPPPPPGLIDLMLSSGGRFLMSGLIDGNEFEQLTVCWPSDTRIAIPAGALEHWSSLLEDGIIGVPLFLRVIDDVLKDTSVDLSVRIEMVAKAASAVRKLLHDSPTEILTRDLLGRRNAALLTALRCLYQEAYEADSAVHVQHIVQLAADIGEELRNKNASDWADETVSLLNELTLSSLSPGFNKMLPLVNVDGVYTVGKADPAASAATALQYLSTATLVRDGLPVPMMKAFVMYGAATWPDDFSAPVVLQLWSRYAATNPMDAAAATLAWLECAFPGVADPDKPPDRHLKDWLKVVKGDALTAEGLLENPGWPLISEQLRLLLLIPLVKRPHIPDRELITLVPTLHKLIVPFPGESLYACMLRFLVFLKKEAPGFVNGLAPVFYALMRPRRMANLSLDEQHGVCVLIASCHVALRGQIEILDTFSTEPVAPLVNVYLPVCLYFKDLEDKDTETASTRLNLAIQQYQDEKARAKANRSAFDPDRRLGQLLEQLQSKRQ
jgi:hypothetical protein